MVARYGSPFYEVRPVSDPAVGTEFEYEAGGRYIERILAIRLRFVASAVVGNRQAFLVADDGTTEHLRIFVNVLVAAAGDVVYCAFPGAPQTTLSGGVAQLPLPDDGLLLMPGWRVRTVTSGIDAGDQYSDIGLLVQRFPTGPSREQMPTIDTQTTER